MQESNVLIWTLMLFSWCILYTEPLRWPNYLFRQSHEVVHSCFLFFHSRSQVCLLSRPKIWPLPTLFHSSHQQKPRGRSHRCNAICRAVAQHLDSLSSLHFKLSFSCFSNIFFNNPSLFTNDFEEITSLDVTSCPAPSCAWCCFVAALCLGALGAINYMSSAWLLTCSSLPLTCMSRSPQLHYSLFWRDVFAEPPADTDIPPKPFQDMTAIFIQPPSRSNLIRGQF